MAERRFRILVCRGPECGDRRGSRAVYDAFAATLASEGITRRCELGWQSCFGRCSQGVNALVRELPAEAPASPPRFALADLPPSRGGGPRLVTALYNRLDPVKAADVVASHVVRGAVATRYIERVDPLAPSSSIVPVKPPGEPDV
ncbi:MAG TPA: (2Fe-2S) ferredoxin domain-containing protein [Kofleriaceae bacterium]|nr:(2Fe-2S) ferredoxin domain-containing protein [Kofleriaceae bacterium]